MTRPHPLDDRPEACAYRRAELVADAHAWQAAHPTKISRKQAPITNKARRTRELKAKIEALRDEADRLEASLPQRVSNADRLGHAADEWERLSPYRNGDELARALGFANEAAILKALYRFGRRAA